MSVQVGSLPVTLVTSTNDVVKAMKSVTGSISVTMNVERDPNWPSDESGGPKSVSERIMADHVCLVCVQCVYSVCTVCAQCVCMKLSARGTGTGTGTNKNLIYMLH